MPEWLESQWKDDWRKQLQEATQTEMSPETLLSEEFELDDLLKAG